MGVFIDSREISKPMQDLTLVMAQLDPLVGDIPGNTERAIESVREARIEHGADIVVLPELYLTGYPPEDLLLRPSMESRLRAARTRMAEKVVRDVLVIVGYPGRREGRLWNLAGASTTASGWVSMPSRPCPTTRCSTSSATLPPAASRWCSNTRA